MAELEDRDRREAEFARKFGKLSAAHRKELNDLLGDPPNPENVPQEFWNKVENEARQKMLALLLLTWMDSAIQHGQDGAAAMTDGAAYALRQAMDVARGYRQHSQELLDDAVTRGDLTNRSQVHELTTKIFGPQRVARVAETETVRAQNRGADSAVRQSGRMLIAYWRHSALRKRHHAGAAFDPCPTCTPLEGKPWWEWGGLKPGDAHPHCVLPGQDVIIPGALIASAKSFYDGPAVEITLANGAVLSITPNHPILTPSGWLAANRVQVGDDLLCATDAERIAGIVQPYHDQIPSLIEDVFHAVEQSSKFHATRVPVSSEDFHGDGACIEGNIQIVNAEGFLRDRLGAAFSQEPNQLAFGDGLGQPKLLAGQSLLSFLSVSSALARDSNMGSVGLSPALASGHSGGAQQPGWRSIADVNPATPENLHDRSAADSYRFSDGIKGFTAGISADQSVDAGNLKCSNRRTLAVLNGGLPMPANLNPAISEQRHDGSEIDPSLAREFVGRFSRLIAPNEVVGVRNFQYRGHVFDIQCGPWSLYLCQGVLCKNCDCFSEYYDPVTQTFLGPSSDPAGLDAWAERFGIRSEPSPIGTARAGGMAWNAVESEKSSDGARALRCVALLEWDESQHPRGRDGKFIPKDRIDAAINDPKIADALRSELPDSEKSKFDALVRRPDNNTSSSKPGGTSAVHADPPSHVTETAEFKHWFAGSKIVDPDGRPLIVYHGTHHPNDFDVFQSRSPQQVLYLDGEEVPIANSWDMGDDYQGIPEGIHHGAKADALMMGADKAFKFRSEEAEKFRRPDGTVSHDTRRHLHDLKRMVGKKVEQKIEDRPTKDGFYFTPNLSYSFVRDIGDFPNGRVLPVYLAIKNPKWVNASEVESAGLENRIEEYKREGYDGVIFAPYPKDLAKDGWSGATQIVAFSPEQIKSATGNKGTFDPSNPKITESVIESWDESKHPRDDHGRFVSSGSIVAAAKDKAKLKALRARVTDPQERKKLDRAVQAAKNQKPQRRSVPARVSSTELRRRGLIVKPVAAPHDEIPAISDHDADATTETRKLMKSGTALSRQTIGSQDDHVNEVVGLTLDNGIKGVFKPDSGQQNEGVRNGMTGLWPEREAAASSLAQIIGMDDLVPETVIRDDPESGRGSFQRWADDSTVANSIEGQKKFDGPADEARAGAFDYLIGNSDRHGGNWMVGNETKKLALIDNGLSFPDSNLRGMFNARILRHLELTGAKVPAECAAWLDKSDAIEAKLKQFGFSKNAVDSTRDRLASLAKHAGAPFAALNRRGVIGWEYWDDPDDQPPAAAAAGAGEGVAK